MLGGWAAQECDRHIRVSRSRIAYVHQLVVTALSSTQEQDPLCDEESLQHFSSFLDNHVSEDEMKKCLNLLGQRTYVGPSREPQSQHEEQPGDLVQLPSEQLLLEEEEQEQQASAKAEARKKQQLWNNECTAKLGTNPREFRRQLRESLDQGFYVAVSSKKKIRILHLLVECYLLPTIDYTTYSFHGPCLPSRSLHGQVCKWCAKSGNVGQKSEGSSNCGTNTSSSTEDGPERHECGCNARHCVRMYSCAPWVKFGTVTALAWTRAA